MRRQHHDGQILQSALQILTYLFMAGGQQLEPLRVTFAGDRDRDAYPTFAGGPPQSRAG